MVMYTKLKSIEISSKKEQMKDAILRIFADDKLAMSYSSSAREHAMQTHDPAKNYRRLLEIYHEINHSI